jgi:abortive infection bacteriophage resistance protein
MKYAKPPLTLEQQADQLLARGMAGDRDLMIARLRSVSYYRLSGYWLPFRNTDDTYKPGTSFDIAWNRYVFDRRLRLLVMDAIERIEVAVRSQLAHHHSLHYGAFAYATDHGTLPKLTPKEHEDFLAHIKEETDRSHEAFAKHFRKKYGDCHDYLPVWMASEVMAFGSVLSFFNGAHRKEKRPVADAFGLPDVVFGSWLLTLHTIRNICAHHGRLWNRELGVKPMIPLKDDYPAWHDPVVVRNNRVFGVLTLCRWCLTRVAPQSRWGERLGELLQAFPDIPRPEMGFPTNWQECPIWAAPMEAENG